MLILDMGALLSPARGQPHSSPQPPPAPQKASTGAPPAPVTTAAMDRTQYLWVGSSHA